MHTCRVDQPGCEAKSLSRVVIAAGDQHPGSGTGQACESVVGKSDRVDRGEGPVVDVAGKHHHVDRLSRHHLEQMVDERSLVIEHPLSMEGAPEMPVGGVEDPHTTNLGAATDTSRVHTPLGASVPSRETEDQACRVREAGVSRRTERRVSGW